MMAATRSASTALGVARAAFVATLGLAVVVFAYGLEPTWSEASNVGARPAYLFAPGQYHLSLAEANALNDIGLSRGWHAGLVAGRSILLFATASSIAALLWLRSRSWAALYVAWFLVGSQFVFSSEGAIQQAPQLIRFGAGALAVVGGVSVFALLLVFPDDRFAPWVFAFAAALLAGIAGIRFARIAADWVWVAGPLLALGMLVAGLVLQVVTALPTRDRARWLLLVLTAAGALLFIVVTLVSDSLSGIGQPGGGLDSIARRLGVETTVMVLPLLFGIGVVFLVVRRGLWDLDLSLNRAFVYSGLTTLLVAVYFLVVVLVGAVVNGVAGVEGSTVAVVISTGLIAVLALPARELIQRFIDRLFFRRRYDLERTVESFEARLRDRDRMELVGSDLLNAASDAFEPEYAALWIPEVRR